MSQFAKKEKRSQEPDDFISKKITKPHDYFFRTFMGNPLAVDEFLKEHLPAIAEKIDPGSLQLIDGTFITPDLQERRTDLIYHATFQEKPGYLYFLLEHQSTPDRLMPLRLMEYFLQIIRRDLKEKGENTPFPIVYPCIIYNGQKPYSYTTSFFEMFANPELAKEIISNPFRLIDLSKVSDRELMKAPFAGFMQMLLKHVTERDVVALIRRLSETIKVLEKANQLDLLEAGIYYLVATNQSDASLENIFHEFQQHITSPTQEHVMTIAERLIEKGRQETMTIAERLVEKGIQQGIEQGIEEGLFKGREEELRRFKSLFTAQLKSRFLHQVTRHYLRLIDKAESDQLFYWIERLATASSIEEVFSCF